MLVLPGSRSPGGDTGDRAASQVLEVLAGQDHGPTLLLCRTGEEEQEARTVRAVLNHGSLGVLALDEPETRFRALAYCLLRLSPWALGQAPVVVSALAPALRTRVALTSVSGLTSPAPSLSQHVQGLLPGTRFALDLGRGVVTKVNDLTWELPRGTRLALWAAQDDSGRVIGNLDRLGIHREPVLPRSRRWPARAWAELTVLDADPEPLVNQALARFARTACPRCGQLATSEGCLLCGTWPYETVPYAAPVPPPTVPPPQPAAPAPPPPAAAHSPKEAR
ncbi:hypothetical protein D4740_03250 [Actinomyces sp. 2119]|uniref:Uncharacterized protein n=1 Tax=Actinomyces lilanjuaniae TaxID=2321394 RepID=A0ABN5PTH3_9ACTO|nr:MULTISPECIES: hypothetical protein [Actinomyces]AYD90574.1 hypothetical protein D5R93_12245 [Actinomyces lilanjuaniae]RJF43974.1 hypothetical protein D4740_03250 [Actinomyces sp. 2119]